MKKLSLFIAIFAACVFGVLFALQIDRWMQRKSDNFVVLDPPPVQPASFEQQLTTSPTDFRAAARKLTPAVVSVDRRDAVRRSIFSDEVAIVPTGTGSGVIINREGYILTNNHVVAGATEVVVRLSDQRSFPARVVGLDPMSDLAVVKIDADRLVPAELADSSTLEVGEWVMAVGNPLGYSNTVSVGVVSSLRRTLPAEAGTVLVDAIQTDASINSGNSGGALANTRGQVVGINTAIASVSGGSIGIGFAIPINRAKMVVNDLLKHGRVRYGWSGIEVFRGPNPLQSRRSRAIISQNVGAEPPQRGLVVREVVPGSPAAQAGMVPLDIVLDVDGQAVSDPTQYTRIMIDKRPGDVITVRYWSAGQTKTAKMTLRDMQTF